MTDISDREKALIEAARTFLNAYGISGNVWSDNLFKAIKAYDTPKAKVPVLPTWQEFIELPDVERFRSSYEYARIGAHSVMEGAYNAIREVTAKEQE